MWQRKTDDRHENGKNTVKLIKTWDKNEKERERERERVCVCVLEREGGKEMALVFKQKGKAKHFGKL